MSERLTFESIAAGGAGVGRLADGRVAFVARTAPGAAQEKAAMRLFGYSILYLFLIFSLLLAEKIFGLAALPASGLLQGM